MAGLVFLRTEPERHAETEIEFAEMLEGVGKSLGANEYDHQRHGQNEQGHGTGLQFGTRSGRSMPGGTLSANELRTLIPASQNASRGCWARQSCG